MKVITFGFDEYGELIGCGVLECGEDYIKERDGWLEENEEDDDSYNEVVELDSGWIINYGWGNYEVGLEVEDDDKIVYLNVDEESEVESYGSCKKKDEEKKDVKYYKWGDGVYVEEFEEDEDMSIEGSRRKERIMVVLEELENVNIREL